MLRGVDMAFTENRTMMGIIVILLLLFVAAVFFYNRTLNDLAAGSCTDSPLTCPHEKVVETQNLVIGVLILVIGVMAAWMGYNTYVKKPDASAPAQGAGNETPETIETKPRARKKKIVAAELEPDEAAVVAIINEGNGSAYQSDIIRKTGFSKVKVSRIIDRMEQKGLVERKRRGMTNLVVAK